MSSPKFSIELTPDPALRRVVVLSGAATAVVGVALIANLPVEASWRAVAGLVWTLHMLRELGIAIGAQRRCLGIRIEPGGSVQIVYPKDCCIAATLLPGSVVLKRLAWLRLRSVDGRRYAELLRRNSAQNEAWRRFQVIWRHLGAGP